MKKILIVDNSIAVKKLIRIELESEEYEIHEASSGEEALAIISKIKPDLITLNVEMRGIDGYKTCSLLRASSDETLRLIPVIFVTGKDTIKEREKGFEAGAADFITKPFKRGDLVCAIKKILFPQNQYKGSIALIVDESPTIRLLLSDCLRLLVENIIVVTKGEEALAVLKELSESVTIMIANYTLPDTTGDKLCNSVHEMGFTMLPMIFISKMNNRDISLKLFKAGALDYILIPFTKEEFIARVRVHLESAWLNHELEKKVNDLARLNKELMVARNSLWCEMELAKKIQTNLLPENPTIAGYDLLVSMTCATEVGGDYYDIIHSRDADWVVIGDVSGHGISAGLIMMMVQTTIHLLLNEFPCCSPAELLGKINKTVYENIKKISREKYMTIQILAIKPDGGIIFSGLHQDYIVFRSADHRIEIITSSGMWLGVAEDIRNNLVDEKMLLQSSDILLLFTDGIVEAMDDQGNMFSFDRLTRILFDYSDKPLTEIRNRIMAELTSYTCLDDVSLILLKKNA